MRTHRRAKLLLVATILFATATTAYAGVTFNMQTALSQLNLSPGSYTSPTVLAPVGLTFVANASGTPGPPGIGTLYVQPVSSNEVHPPGTTTRAFFFGPGIAYNVLNCTTLAWTGAGSLTAFTITRPGMANGASIPAWAMYAYDASGNLLSSTGEGDLTNGSYMEPPNYADFTVSSSTPIANVVFCSHNGYSTYNALPLSGANATITHGTPTNEFVYVAGAGGVFAYNVDTAGALTQVAGSPFLTQATPQDGYAVTVDPSGKFVYLTNVDSTGGPGSAVVAYAIDSKTGALTLVPSSPFQAGAGPFSVAVHPSGKFAYTANFNSNDISAYTIDGPTGALSQITGSPFPDPAGCVGCTPGPVSVAVDPSGKFAYVANYGAAAGLSGAVMAYTIDGASGALSPVPGSPFSDPNAAPGPCPTVCAPGPYSVAVHPSGKFLYVANTWVDNVSAFAIDSTTGALSLLPGSPFATPMPSPGVAGPYSVAVDPSGKFAYVALWYPNSIAAYRIDSASGALSPVSGSPFAAGPNPNSVAVDPSGKFVYVANGGGDNNVLAFAIDSNTGALSRVPGSPFTAGGFNPAASSAAVAVASEVTSPTCVAPPSGMVAWWPGDGNANDVVGGNNGTPHGGATFAPGEVGQAFNFDGSTGYVQVPQNSLWEFGSNDFTVDFWVNFRTPNTSACLDCANVFDMIGVDEGAGAFNKWVVRFGGGYLALLTNSNGTYEAKAPFSPNLNQWYFLAVTRSGNTFTTYINGQAAGTSTSALTINYINAPLTWGLVEAGRYLNGLMDEIEIYNRGLSATEIQAIFNAGSGGKCKTGLPQATALSVAPVNAVYGGTANLQATLTKRSDNPAVSGEMINFTLNNQLSGTATTDTSGVATVTGVSLAGINAGTYSTGVGASFAGDANFAASSGTGQLVISQAPATVTLSNLTYTYDGTVKSATASTTPTGLTVSLTYNGSPTPPTNAGSYNVIATVTDPNYQGSTNGVLTINKATATVTLSNLSYNYDGMAKSATVTTNPPNLTTSVTYNNFAVLPTNAGSYNVIATVTDANYQGSNAGTLTINKVPLTIKANNVSRPYGSPNPVLGASYSGFVGSSEGPAVLVGTLNCTTTAVSGNGAGSPGSPPGPYPITCGGQSSNNYNITYVAGTLTVMPAPLVSLSASSIVFPNQLVGIPSGRRNVTLTNPGTAPLHIAGIGISGDFSQTNTCGSSVAVNASCTISVRFVPTATGTRTGAVTLTDDASGSPQQVGLTGTGIAAAVFPATLTFAARRVGTTSPPQHAFLGNVSTAAISITGVTITGPNSSDFSQTSNCGSSLNGRSVCIINVTFAPKATGTRKATLQITDSDPSSPQTVTLTGAGR